MTTVQDFITNLNGTPANGRLVINSPPMTVGGVAVAASQIEAPIVEGAVTVEVYPNINAQPTGVYYTVFYELDQGPVYEENWIVPNLPKVNIGQIRAAFPQTPSIMINAQQLTSAGALPGQFLGWSGANWVPMYVTSFNYYPNFIGLNVTAANAPDLAVTGSPASLGSNFTLNVPDAGPTSRGVVNAVTQTFGGNKTFANNVAIVGGLTGAGAVFTNVTVTGELLATGSSNLMIDPTTAKGDLITRAATGPAARFPVGVNGMILTADSTQSLGLRWGQAPLVDPTQNLGDLIVRGASAVQRLGVAATNGYVLTADSGQPLGMSWEPAAGGVPVTRRINTGLGLTGGGALSSDLTLSAVPDTTNQQVAVLLNSAPAPVGVRRAINFSAGANVTIVVGDDPTDNWVNVTIASTGGPLPPGTVTSVFGRNGDVVAAIGDYTAAQVTNAVSVLGSYANPPWITSFAWSKLTGVPSTFPPSPHTHDAADIVSGIIAPARLGTGAANNSVFLRGDSVWAAPPGGNQTPWTSNIDGAGFQLRNAGWIGIGTSTIPLQSPIAGRAYLTILGSTDAGVLELATGAADADATLVGRVAFTDPANNQSDKRSAFIDAYRSGVAAGNRGSLLAFWTRSDGGSTPSERMVLTNAGRLGVGNLTPAYMIDAAGDINTTGVYRVNGVPFTGGVSTVFGRSGAVVAQSGDYTAAQVTNAVSALGSYADPAWITSLAYSKITGAPASLWQAGSGGAIYYNGGNVGIGTATPGTTLHVKTGASGVAAIAGAVIHAENSSDAFYEIAAGAGHTAGLVFSANATSNTASIAQVWDGANYLLQFYNAAPGSYMRMVTGGVEAMRITSTGNVGIGTTTPVNTLDVNGPVSIRGDLAAWSTSKATASVRGLVLTSSGDGSSPMQGSINLICDPTGTNRRLAIQAVEQQIAFRNVTLCEGGGNVGIGTTTPGFNLETAGSVRVLGATTPPSTGAGLELVYSGGIAYVQPFDRAAGAYKGLSFASSTMSLQANGNPIALQPAGGNVGIGIGAPDSTLHVVGDVHFWNPADFTGSIYLGSSKTAGKIWYDNNNGRLNFNLGATTVFCAYNGFVGINNQSPAYRLDIGGSVNITGQYMVNGTPIATGGGVTQWTNYSAVQRPLNTLFTNNTGKPLYVSVCATTTITIQIGGNIIAQNNGPAGAVVQAFTVVMPGLTYEADSTGGWQRWTEWW